MNTYLQWLLLLSAACKDDVGIVTFLQSFKKATNEVRKMIIFVQNLLTKLSFVLAAYETRLLHQFVDSFVKTTAEHSSRTSSKG